MILFNRPKVRTRKCAGGLNPFGTNKTQLTPSWVIEFLVTIQPPAGDNAAATVAQSAEWKGFLLRDFSPRAAALFNRTMTERIYYVIKQYRFDKDFPNIVE
jgi:hypothetical protein